MDTSRALGELSEAFINARVTALESKWADRNRRADDMVKLYKLDTWSASPPQPNERRVTVPRAYTVVESQRALLFTRRPVIEAPPSIVTRVAQERASKIEKYLYGVWDMTGMMQAVDDCEFGATCLGQGVLRVVYDPTIPRGELPLVPQYIDTRNYYNEPDPRRPLQDMEACVSCQRTRREIAAEWGEDKLQGEPDEGMTREEWLDSEVEFVDYWVTRIVQEEVEAERMEEEAPGALSKALSAAGLGEVLGEQELFRWRRSDEGSSVGGGPERQGDQERAYDHVRVVLHAILADGRFVKAPVVMPGYESLPFFRWAGVRTPLEAEDSCLSVLFAIAGGVRENGAQGLLATENEFFSLKLRLAEQRAQAAFITNDDALADLDSSPGAVNVTNKGRGDLVTEWAAPPGEPPETESVLRQIAQLQEDATVPSSMMGRFEAGASGIALSMVTNPVLMKIAAKQRDREDVLQRMNAHILALTEEYAPTKGWTVYGLDRNGQEMEARLAPAEIGGYRRNRVHLSARLPKDAPNEVLMFNQLVNSKILSRRTAIEKAQQVLDLAGQSPEDETKQVLIEDIIFGVEETRKALAKRALAEYDVELAAAVELLEQPPASPPQGPPGPGPMQGMPPNAAPPQGLPMMVGAQNPQAMLNMTGPQGPGMVAPPGGGA